MRGNACCALQYGRCSTGPSLSHPLVLLQLDNNDKHASIVVFPFNNLCCEAHR